MSGRLTDHITEFRVRFASIRLVLVTSMLKFGLCRALTGQSPPIQKHQPATTYSKLSKKRPCFIRSYRATSHRHYYRQVSILLFQTVSRTVVLHWNDPPISRYGTQALDCLLHTLPLLRIWKTVTIFARVRVRARGSTSCFLFSPLLAFLPDDGDIDMLLFPLPLLIVRHVRGFRGNQPPPFKGIQRGRVAKSASQESVGALLLAYLVVSKGPQEVSEALDMCLATHPHSVCHEVTSVLLFELLSRNSIGYSCY